MNLYAYVGNNPLRWIDPFGFDKGKPWWQKLEEGYYYGTGFGQQAVEFYAYQQITTDNWLWAIPGSVASLWTPETFQATGWTLVSGGSLASRAANNGTWLGTIGFHAPHHGLGRHFEIILRLPGGKNWKLIIPGKDRLIWRGIK
jgi:hypothetical protein